MANWTVFPFGKYARKPFKSCKELRYLTWFIGKLDNEVQIKHCAEAISTLVTKLQSGKVKRYKEHNR